MSYHISCVQTISKRKLKEGTGRERRVWGRETSRGRWGDFSLTEALSLNSWVLVSSRFVKAHKVFFGKCCRNPRGSGLRYSKCHDYPLRNTLSLITGELLYLCMFIISGAQQLLSFTCILSWEHSMHLIKGPQNYKLWILLFCVKAYLLCWWWCWLGLDLWRA